MAVDVVCPCSHEVRVHKVRHCFLAENADPPYAYGNGVRWWLMISCDAHEPALAGHDQHLWVTKAVDPRTSATWRHCLSTYCCGANLWQILHSVLARGVDVCA